MQFEFGPKIGKYSQIDQPFTRETLLQLGQLPPGVYILEIELFGGPPGYKGGRALTSIHFTFERCVEQVCGDQDRLLSLLLALPNV